jgi:hypothetical protein
MRENQTILTITKIVPAGKPTTTILSFKEPHEAKTHLDAFFIAEKEALAAGIDTLTDNVPLIPSEDHIRRKIITEREGQQDFDILANHYHVAWLNIDGCSSVTNEEMQSALDGFVNSGRTKTEYAQVAESISRNMHRYCQNELWKFVKEIIRAFALGPHDERNKTAANQALELQGFIENSNEF